MEGTLYEVLIHELCNGPRNFTKLMKPPIAVLRMEDRIIAIYLNGLINVSYTYVECRKKVSASC